MKIELINKIKGYLPPDELHLILPKLPNGYKRFGNVVVLYLPEELEPYYRGIGDAYLTVLGVDSVINLRRINGEFRKPESMLIAGKHVPARYLENGSVFTFDPLHIMFSPGNKHIREVVASDIKSGDVIVDMFAGIGYFSIPSALKDNCHIYSIEKNWRSFYYLTENIKNNRVEERITPIFGDCRNLMLPVEATKVYMGYFGNTVSYLPYAFEFGGDKIEIYLHDVVSRFGGIPQLLEETKNNLAKYRLEEPMHVREVKEVSGGKIHVMVKIQVKKQ